MRRLELLPTVADQERPATPEDIRSLILGSPNPDFVDQCHHFLDAYRAGDEIIEYRTSASSWENLMGSHGFALRRAGSIVASLVIRIN